MIGEIAVVRLIINGSVTLHLYSTFYKIKSINLRFSTGMRPKSWNSMSVRNATFAVTQAFFIPLRQYSDRLGIYRSIKVSGNNYRKSPAICFIFSSISTALRDVPLTYMIEMSIESSYFPTTHLVFQYRPSHNTLASRIPAFFPMESGVSLSQISTLQ